MSQFYRYLLDARIVWRCPWRAELALADRMPEHRKCFPYGAGIRGSGTWRRGWDRLALLPGAVRNCMQLRDPACGLPFDRDPQLASVRERSFLYLKTPGERTPKSLQTKILAP